LKQRRIIEVASIGGEKPLAKLADSPRGCGGRQNHRNEEWQVSKQQAKLPKNNLV
jgi:hypothetical protein